VSRGIGSFARPGLFRSAGGFCVPPSEGASSDTLYPDGATLHGDSGSRPWGCWARVTPPNPRLGHNLRDSGGRFDLEAMVGEFRRTLHEEMVRFLMAVSEGDGEEVLDRDTGPVARFERASPNSFPSSQDSVGVVPERSHRPRLPSPPLASPPP